MYRNLCTRKKRWANKKRSLLHYLQSRKYSTNKELLKVRWLGLFFLFTLTFILLSNSHSVRWQSSAIATEIKPQSFETATPVQQNTPSQEDTNASVEILNDQPLALLPEVPIVLPAANTDISNHDELSTKHTWIIRSGDTLTHILQHFGVYSSFGDIISMGKEAKPLLYLRAGKRMHLDVRAGDLHKITYEKTRTKHFILEKSKHDGFIAEYYALPTKIRTATAKGFIHRSFYKAALDANLKDEIIIQTAKILGWDIDFVLDIRQGDFFSIVYEEEVLDGIKIGNGKILAVTLINRGKPYRAIFYTDTQDNSGYYSLDGKDVRKPFLRTPLDFIRVSSKFALKRWHPILKTNRPHRGVDYAASIGTPVFSTANGRITYRGWKAGYGNVVMIDHFNTYTTVYAHLSKFASKLQVGSKVQQGEDIGYVGMTGYATGPHLHYEFRVDGRHKNPLTIQLPDSKPLPKTELARFKENIQPLLTQLNALEKSYAAVK